MRFIILALAVIWVVVRPDLWPWALGFVVVCTTMVKLAHKNGVKQGLEGAISMNSDSQGKQISDKNSPAEDQFEAFNSAVTVVDLFAYELKKGLVPEGDSEDNPGLGPMNFDEWREWKEREFERTGNIWHNHPGGSPPPDW